MYLGKDLRYKTLGTVMLSAVFFGAVKEAAGFCMGRMGQLLDSVTFQFLKNAKIVIFDAIYPLVN